MVPQGQGRQLLRPAATVICTLAAIAAVVLLVGPAEQLGTTTLVENKDAKTQTRKPVLFDRLDDRLQEISGAEKTAAGAIDVLWKETDRLPAAAEYDPHDRRDVDKLNDRVNGVATWSTRWRRVLEALNERELPEAEEIAPANLAAQWGQSKRDGVALSARRQDAKEASSGANRDSALEVAASRVARARATKADVAPASSRALPSVVAKKSVATARLKSRTMMLTEVPSADKEGRNGDAGAGAGESEAGDTEMAIEDAMQDEHMGREEQLGDTLQGKWHAPMWPNGDDEGSPVLTSTIAAPGQGGEYAYGFPYDEAKLFSLDGAGGGNETGANASSTEEALEASPDDAAEADGDIVDAAEEEAVQKSKAMAASGSSATPFYQGVGAGGEFGPSGVGGWDDKPTPPAMPDEEQREAWLQQRANGYVIARFTG